jgi:GxxExxY protein
LDLIVEDKVIIELKAVEKISNVHLAQTLTYLKICNKKLGLLLNFDVKYLKSGIKRVVNNL